MADVLVAMNSPRFPGIGRVYLNGEFVAADEARVSVFDRGMIFGDGIYEVIPAYGGAPFRWSQHLERLNGNLAAVGIAPPFSRAEWERVLTELTGEGGGRDQYVYLQVTRGVAPRDHAFPPDARPTVFAYAQVLPAVPREQIEHGVAVVTAEDYRWMRCDLKTTSLIANVMLRQYAKERGVMEAVLIRDGMVTEGAATNIFAVLDGVVRSAPHGPRILPGITRDLVVELLGRHGIAHEERAFSAGEMRAAEEVWLTSSTKEILPITRIDGAPVAGGGPGAVFKRTLALFQAYKDECRKGREA
jgi:D-alanine transaminase